MTDNESNELDRLARRQGIREKMARAAMRYQRRALLLEEIRRSDERKEQAAEQHRLICEPLQQELERLEQRAIRRIGERLPPDETEDNRRREILSEISAANVDLETLVQREDKARQPFVKEAEEIQKQGLAPESIREELAHPSVANPELLVQLFCAQQKMQWADARSKAAEAARKTIVYNVNELNANRMRGDLPAQLRRLEGWNREIEAARKDQAAAMAEAQGLHQQMIDE